MKDRKVSNVEREREGGRGRMERTLKVNAVRTRMGYIGGTWLPFLCVVPRTREFRQRQTIHT